jgi:hypothetical protein
MMDDDDNLDHLDKKLQMLSVSTEESCEAAVARRLALAIRQMREDGATAKHIGDALRLALQELDRPPL